LEKKQSPLPPYFPAIKVSDFKFFKITKNEETGKSKKTRIFYSYQDFEYDIEGWAESKKYLPDDFDLVYMRLEREKTIPGWINGSIWCGLRLKPQDKVIFWKRKLEEKDA
jgi:hypothetical protein